MLKFFLNLSGRVLAVLPDGVKAALCAAAGWLICALPGGRRRTVRANLHHAFPGMSEAARRRIARRSAARTVETGLYVLAAPFLSDAELRRRFHIGEVPEAIREAIRQGRPIVSFQPHFALLETTTLTPLLYEGEKPPVGVVYRPFKSAALEDWVKATRSRFGPELLSRKAGFQRAVAILRGGGWVTLLFDQNAGGQGALTVLMGRLCSTSDLPASLAARFGALPVAHYPRRTGFWRAEIRFEVLDVPVPADAPSLTLAANAWLERKLREEPWAREGWLWLHSRWRTQNDPYWRFQLKAKRDFLDAERARHGGGLPRGERLWVRLPNWLGDVVMALPLLRALRKARPDMALTCVARAHFLPLLEYLGVGESFQALPAKALRRWAAVRSWRTHYPDTHVLFTNSVRGDIEARLTGAPQRFGMLRPGKRRPFLTHAWPVPPDLDEHTLHQSEVWRRMLAHFGLTGMPDFTPFSPAAQPATQDSRRVGFICGTENDPSKRWPAGRWRELAEGLLESDPDLGIELYGTAGDRPITAAVACGLPPGRVRDRAGQTGLRAFADALRGCAVLACNDTGGMHLANALGVPVAAVYGPTNPLRTGPVFDAPKTLVQPAGCPPAGGASIADVPARRVLKAVQGHLMATPRRSETER